MPPITIMATGDDHFRTGPRFSECGRVHTWIAGEVAERRPDLFLLTGDLYHADSTPDERSAAADFLTAVASVCPVVLVRGNHDRRRDLRILARLATKHPVTVEEGAAVHHVAGVAVAAVAWPDRASIAAMLGRAVPAETTDAAARAMMIETFTRLGDELAQHQGPRLLMGHFMLGGACTEAGQPIRGAELALRLEDFAHTRAHAVIMGHVHAGQAWSLPGGEPVIYAGSPLRHDYGEPGPKSILTMTLDDTGVVAWSRIPTPARPMHLLRGTYDRGTLTMNVPDDVAGADVRLRYDVPDAHRVAAAMAAQELRARLLAQGAADVKVDPVPDVVVRVRSPEVAAETTREGQLRARWALRGVPEDRQARLMAKYERVKAAVR